MSKSKKEIDVSKISLAKAVEQYDETGYDINFRSWLVSDVVAKWYADMGIKRVKRGMYLDSKGEVIKVDSLYGEFFLCHAKMIKKGSSITAGVLKWAFSRYLAQLDDAERTEAKEAIRFSGVADDGPLLNWMYGMTGLESITPVDLAVMKHCIWQVKRKAFNLPVKNHMMVVFSGAQNAGKSENIRHLLRPLGPLTVETSAKYLTDDRSYSSFNDFYVMFVDELADAKKADMDTLKHVITAPEVSYRPMRTNDLTTVRQNCTFISCINHSLADVLLDTTGMRRFWEITLSPTYMEQHQEHWARINGQDHLAIWRSIDENVEVPFIAPFFPEIHVKQEEMKQLTSVEEWVLETGMVPCADGVGVKESATQLFLNYRKHCQEFGRIYPFTQTRFGRELRKLGFIKAKETLGIFYYYTKHVKHSMVAERAKALSIALVPARDS